MDNQNEQLNQNAEEQAVASVEPTQENSETQAPAEPEKPNYLTAPVRRKKKQKKGGALKRKKQEIMNDPEKRKKSVKMGVTAIILCLISIALCYPAVWLAVQVIIYGFTHFYYVIGNAVIIFFGLSLPGLLLISQIYQFILSGAQLQIRKDWFGWLCIVISIITVFAIMVLCFFSLRPVLDGLSA